MGCLAAQAPTKATVHRGDRTARYAATRRISETTATAPDGTPLPDGGSVWPRRACPPVHQLVDEGHATVDRDAGIVTFSLSDGSVLDVRFAVDAHAPEGHWYVQGGRHEFTPAGWQQREPVTIVLAGEVRTDQTAVVADLRRQVLQALSQVCGAAWPISACYMSPGTGALPGRRRPTGHDLAVTTDHGAHAASSGESVHHRGTGPGTVAGADLPAVPGG